MIRAIETRVLIVGAGPVGRLPADYPNDVASRTTVTGIELSRVTIPSRSERYTAAEGPDTRWPTPEPPHRVNQTYFEPVLFAHAASQSRIRILDRTAAHQGLRRCSPYFFSDCGQFSVGRGHARCCR